jgi:hypothetical protein
MEYNIFGLLPHWRSSSAKYFLGFRDAFLWPPHRRLWAGPPDDAGSCLFGRMRPYLHSAASSAMVLLYVLHWTDPKLLLGSDVPWVVHVYVCDGSHSKHYLNLTNAFCYE